MPCPPARGKTPTPDWPHAASLQGAGPIDDGRRRPLAGAASARDAPLLSGGIQNVCLHAYL